MINDFKELALQGVNSSYSNISRSLIEDAICIRLTEEKLLELFAQGKMNGTVHTCVGQEFSALAVAGQLNKGDIVTSNHRCHGHFIAKTGDWRGLLDELMGVRSGVCFGVGSSQHLYAKGFLSNGPQGALLPVASGIAWNAKLCGEKNIVVSYIGEGTLGEGALYETLNLDALLSVPHLIVCENNLYSQSTFQVDAVSGQIAKRPEAFGIRVFEADTWNFENLFDVARNAINYVRSGFPAFFLIKTYRLNAHSKGDDNRNIEEVNFFKKHDPLTRIMNSKDWVDIVESMQSKINLHIENVDRNDVLDLKQYIDDQLPRKFTNKLIPVANKNIRMVQALNQLYRHTLESGAFHIGEDISDPYGGAFKVTKGLSTEFPGQVMNAPISEAAITGFGIGVSMMGSQTYVEIMFGDFITHTFDQLINNASKFHHMYAFQVSVPLRMRMPMGGKRGYGPTHSQSLEKFIVGIDNVGVLALSSLIDPGFILEGLKKILCPLILIENKVDYGKYLWSDTGEFNLFCEDRLFGSLILSPKNSNPSITLVSYGETARHIADNLERIFDKTDTVPELICLTQLHPLDLTIIKKSIKISDRLVIIEDGSIDFGIGAEVVAKLADEGLNLSVVLRIGAEPVPIPSIAKLENKLLPTIDRVIEKINARLRGGIND